MSRHFASHCAVNVGRRKPSAFTLIEMLLVVAIISLLISILLPNLKRSSGQAKRTQCEANIRMLLIGYQEYAKTNGRKLMGANTSNPHDWLQAGNAETSITGGKLWNFVRSKDSYKCPDHVYPWYLNSYAINGMLNGEQVWDGFTSKIHWTSNIVDAKQLVFVEEDDNRGWNMNSWMLGGTNSFIDLPANNHANADNFGFLDGHVELFAWTDADMQKRPKHNPTPTFGFNDPGNSDWARLPPIFRTWPTP
jgi:prepilin-type N-terminal cleavage/methylation domain-containing protein/prepilin-type processing-associated H-X9-DG protein